MANYGNISIFGDPRSPGWEDQNLVTVRAPNGQLWRVNKMAAPSFTGFLGDLYATGYAPQSSGGFNYRTIRGSDQLSQHAFGNAIDIGAAANPMGGTTSDLPSGVSELAAKYGLEWGGNWQTRPDPMHFEWIGPNGAVGPAGGPAPAPTGGATAPVTMPGMDPMGQIAAQFIQGQQDRVQQQAAKQQEDTARRAALFAPPAGVASLYG